MGQSFGQSCDHIQSYLAPCYSSECLSWSYPLTHIPWMDQNVSASWREDHSSFAPFTLYDQVLKREQLSSHLTRNKLILKYSGPYEIVKVNSNGVTYEVMIEGLPVRVHYAQLKSYIALPKYLEGYGLGDLQNASEGDIMEVAEDQGAAYEEGSTTDESDSGVPSGIATSADNVCIDFLGGGGGCLESETFLNDSSSGCPEEPDSHKSVPEYLQALAQVWEGLEGILGSWRSDGADHFLPVSHSEASAAICDGRSIHTGMRPEKEFCNGVPE